MSESKVYSARTVFEGMKKTFHQYLEAQYHIWDEGMIAERRRLLNQPGVSFQEPQLEATPFYVSGRTYRQLSIPVPAQEILTLASSRPNVGIYPEPYLHQSEAIEACLGRNEELIVATGTGSGKTESFLMPILGSLAVESAQRPGSWKLPGVRALLLYPMNALVSDQLARLRRLLGDADVAKALQSGRDRRATFGMYTELHIRESGRPQRTVSESESYWSNCIKACRRRPGDGSRRKGSGLQKTSNVLLSRPSAPVQMIRNYFRARKCRRSAQIS